MRRTTPRPQAAPCAICSPEVLSGRLADEADDVWSLCVVLYEMVSGRHPFAAAGINEMVDRIRRQRLGRVTGPAASVEDRIGRDRVRSSPC